MLKFTEKVYLEKLSEYLKYIQVTKIDKDLLSEILEFLLPKKDNKLLVNYEIESSSEEKNAACYVPLYNTIYVRIEQLIEWIEVNYKDFCDVGNIDDELIKSYLLLYLLVHEIEHSYQGLVRLSKVEIPCNIVGVGYSTFMGLLISSNGFYNPIKSTIRNIRLSKYYKNEQYYVLERNANLEASIAMLSLAKYTENPELTRIFLEISRAYSLLGYEVGTSGCMLNTFRDLLYSNIYKRTNKDDIKDEYRVRFGLEISKEKRNELFKTCSKSYNKVFK